MSNRLLPLATVILFPLIAISSRPLAARGDEPLRYDWQADQAFAYRAKISVPIDKLSEADQQFVQQAQESARKPPNPFE